MLGFILPGLRDLRTALISGVMWVLGLYLIIGDGVVGSAEQLGVTPRAQQVLDFVGHGGALAALTVLCVLVGQMTSGIVERLSFSLTMRNMRRRIQLGVDVPEPRDLLGLFRPASRRSMQRLRDAVDELDELDRARKQEVLAGSLHEVLFISPRLLAVNPGLYTEFDRIRGESEFRDGIVLPLPVVTAGICSSVDISGLGKLLAVGFSIVLALFLFYQARRSNRVAFSIVVHSVAEGLISTAALSEAQKRISQRTKTGGPARQLVADPEA